MNKVLSSGLVIAATISFMGCNGGNSDDKGTASNSVTTGTAYYIDSAVSGINYKCGSQEGTTGADGSFTFEEGQGCTFYLGDVELRGVDADLLDDGKNVYEIDTKIARILQSMDTDGNPDNGITISAEMIEALAEEGITSLPETEEELDAMLDVIEKNGGTMVTEDDAQAHLDKTREEAEAEGDTVPTPAPTATPTSAPTPTATPTPTPTPEPSFQFTTSYLNGKTFYYVKKDDFGWDEMKWNMASMEFTVNTFAWTEYDTADGGTGTFTYSIDAEGNIIYYYDEPTDTTVISSPEVTNDYIKVCEDGDCNTYLFFDESKAMTFRDSNNGDFTQEIVSANPWYIVEDEDEGGTVYCNGLFTMDGNNNLTVSWDDNEDSGSATGSYSIDNGKFITSHDGKTETETLLTSENDTIITEKLTVYDDGSDSVPGNKKWYKNKADAETFLAGKGVASCFP